MYLLRAALCSVVLPVGTMAAGDAPGHLLDPAFDLGRAMERHTRNDVSDYACKPAKIDRIGGELREHEEIQIKVRIPKEKDGVVAQEFSIFLEHVSLLKPKAVGFCSSTAKTTGRCSSKSVAGPPAFCT